MTRAKLSLEEVARLTAGKPVLVVVDMQPQYFKASRDQATLAAVKAEILGAKERGEPIVVLEFILPGLTPTVERSTAAELVEVLEDENTPAIWVLKFKTTVDGSKQVLTACRTFGFNDGHFRLCGVNLSACVFQTALGMLNHRPLSRVEVLAGAVNDSLCEDPWMNFDMVLAITVVK